MSSLLLQLILINFLAVVAATFLSLFVGLFVPVLVASGSRRRTTMFAAVSSGLMFWFFLDVMNDAVLLDVNRGFAGGLEHVAIFLLFPLGVILLFGFERVTARSRFGSGVSGVAFTIAALVALGIGFHAMGEGIEIGSLVPTASSIIDSVGGFGPGIAYVLHKFLEGIVVGTFAIYGKARTRWVPILGLISGIPTVIGLLLALVTPINAAYFFALGGAAAVYIECKTIPNFMTREKGSLSNALLLLLGFCLMYVAGLFHG